MFDLQDIEDLTEDEADITIHLSSVSYGLVSSILSIVSSRQFKNGSSPLTPSEADTIDAQLATLFLEINTPFDCEAPNPNPIETLMGDEEPGNEALSSGDPGVAGLRFNVAVPGVVLGVRYWRRASQPNGNIGYLWHNDTTLLDSAEFPDDETGWTIAMFDTPVAIEAETDYIVGVGSSGTIYQMVVGFHDSVVTNGNITAPADNPSGNRQAPFQVTNETDFPTLGVFGLSFTIDLEFQADE